MSNCGKCNFARNFKAGKDGTVRGFCYLGVEAGEMAVPTAVGVYGSCEYFILDEET